MQAKPKKNDQVNFLYQDLIDQLNPSHPLLKLAEKIPWQIFEDVFIQLYCGAGRPAKRVRLMVGLLILKHENLSDERVVEAWVQNPYFQAFCGEIHFQWQLPCDPSELVYFRKRIGENGVRLIFESSEDIHGSDAKETEVLVDSTVQEKNITFPTDVKLLTKIILKCRKIAEAEGIQLRRELPQLLRKRAKRRKEDKLIRTIAGVLIRELERKLPREALTRHQEKIEFFRQRDLTSHQPNNLTLKINFGSANFSGRSNSGCTQTIEVRE